MKKFFSLFLVIFSVLCFSTVVFGATEEEIINYDYKTLVDAFMEEESIDKDYYNKYLFFKYEAFNGEVTNLKCFFLNENQSAYFSGTNLKIVNPSGEKYYSYTFSGNSDINKIPSLAFNTTYVDYPLSTIQNGLTDFKANFNITYTYTKDGVEITNTSTRDTYADNFFPVSPGGMTQVATLPEIAQESHLETAFQEILGLIPILMVCLVGFLGLRKALTLLSKLLHQS